MVEPLVNIDKNVQKMVRELIDKAPSPEISEVIEEISDDIEDFVDSSLKGQKDQEETNKGFMKTFVGIKGIFKGVGDAMVDIKGYFGKVISNLTGHMREILGPVAEAYDFMKDTLTSMFDTMKGVWTKLFISTGIQQKFMAGLFNVFKRKEKKDARDEGKIKKTVLGFFSLIGGIIGILLGSIIGIVGKPLLLITNIFKVAYKIVKGIVTSITTIGKILKNVIGKTKIGSVFFRWISSFFARLKSIRASFLTALKLDKLGIFFKWIGTFFKSVGDKAKTVRKILGFIPGFNSLLKGLRFGFKWFGWPLTIILSLIDGIKTFVTTKGPMVEKIKASLVAVFDSIFELPIKILAWIPNKILEMFGIDIDIGDTVINFFHNLIGNITNWIAAQFTIDKLTSVKDKIMEMFESIKNFFFGFINVVKTFFSGDLIRNMMPKILGGKGMNVKEVFSNAWDGKEGSGVGDAVNNTNKLKNKAENEKMDKFIASEDKKGKEMLKAFNETMKNDKANNTSIMSNRSGGSDSGQKPIVKDSGNGFFNFMNSNVYGGS